MKVKKIEKIDTQNLRVLGKVLLLSTFFLSSCAVSMSKVSLDLAKAQESRWENYLLEGKVEFFKDELAIKDQDVVIKKSNGVFEMGIFDGGVFGFIPKALFYVKIDSLEISLEDRQGSSVLSIYQAQEDPFLSTIIAFANIDEFYKQRKLKIGNTKIRLNGQGSIKSLSNGMVKIIFTHENNELGKIAIKVASKLYLEYNFKE